MISTAVHWSSHQIPIFSVLHMNLEEPDQIFRHPEVSQASFGLGFQATSGTGVLLRERPDLGPQVSSGPLEVSKGQQLFLCD